CAELSKTETLGRLSIASTANGIVFVGSNVAMHALLPDAIPVSLDNNEPVSDKTFAARATLLKAASQLSIYASELELTDSAMSKRSQIRPFSAAVSSKSAVLDTLPVDFARIATFSNVSPLKLAVWKILRSIPHGSVWDYSKVAARIDKPKAVRAVAKAIGSNIVPLVVPCHRVIGRDGKMRGFSFPGGITVKRKLLKMETGKLFIK
ncbi:hypothetical protein HK100_011596, partial [Physocladia obscura]